MQAVKFIGISGIGWLLDFGLYTILSLFSPNLMLNNSVSSWVGVTFSFICSTRAVFKNGGKIPLMAKYALYLVYQFVLILLVSRILSSVNLQIIRMSDSEIIRKSSFVIAKIVITPITMILNFFVMRGVIEKI